MLDDQRSILATRLRHKAMQMRHKTYDEEGVLDNTAAEPFTLVEECADWIDPQHPREAPPSEVLTFGMFVLAVLLGLLAWWY